MDQRGSILAYKIAKSKTITVAINSMVFIRPVALGDVVRAYAKLINIGTTSLKLNLRTYVIRKNSYMRELVTQAEFIYVKIDENNIPELKTMNFRLIIEVNKFIKY
ncbi:acyl-CoA thioesterase [Francisella uliginis]|uniref:acyl-CoA thioesterase n=1 Tax=Francisella uliginis TaxID=573570 RepID=UPI0009FCDD62|nr:hotdog domain-containing protein [Francisella uliginis]